MMNKRRYRWSKRDEVPEDDGTSTGRYFLQRQVLRGWNPVTGDEDWDDVDGPNTLMGPYWEHAHGS